MPWRIEKRDEKYCVVKDDESAETVACHDSEDAAKRRMAALYASEPATKAILDSDETLVMFGEHVKALGDGKIGGLLAPFGSPATADARRDFFSENTDFGLDVSTRTRALFNHGFTKAFGRKKLGIVGMGLSAAGVEAVEPLNLDMKNDLHRFVYSEADDGKLYWSTGTAPHLMSRRDVDGARELLSWPITEASLTYTPVNKSAVAMALKSLVVEGTTLNESTLMDGLVAGSSLVERSRRLVADVREILGLSRKALEQRQAEGRDLSPEKRDALKALPAEFREVVAALEELTSVSEPEPQKVHPDPDLLARLEGLLGKPKASSSARSQFTKTGVR